MKKIVISDKLADVGIERLKARAELDVDVAVGLDLEELKKRLSDADGLIVRSGTKVTSELMDAAPRLSVIGRAGIGVDNIDIPAATERGIVVLNTPDANATTTAELTIAHLLSLSRHLPQADHSVRTGGWERSKFVGTELSGKTVGIVGFGTIGRIVASRCLGLKMHVVAHDPFVTDEAFNQAGATPAPLEELLAISDYVTLHCPLNDATRNVIGAAAIDRMKSGARLLNCARGGLVDETALIQALESGKLAGAALDVYSTEPPAGSKLLNMEQVVLTPHLGASTREAQTKVAESIADQVATFVETGEAINAINLPPVSSDELARLRPYQQLANTLGRLLAHTAKGPLEHLEVGLFGRAAEVDSSPVAIEALVGLLDERMDLPVNRVNAKHLGERQGIALVEMRSETSKDYVSLVTLTGRNGDYEASVAGTLLGEKHPRLVRINEFEVEAVPVGTLLLTRHDDKPGVIGAIGSILGSRSINISRMQVGKHPEREEAIAVVSISDALDADGIREVEGVDAIRKVLQVHL